jgi:hypothetical protein
MNKKSLVMPLPHDTVQADANGSRQPEADVVDMYNTNVRQYTPWISRVQLNFVLQLPR